ATAGTSWRKSSPRLVTSSRPFRRATPRRGRASSRARRPERSSTTSYPSSRRRCRRDDGSRSGRLPCIRFRIHPRVRGRGRDGVDARARAALHGPSPRNRSGAHQASDPRRRARPRGGGAAPVRIEVFIDDETVPRHRLEPPAAFDLDTEGLTDGPHRLRAHAIGDSGTAGSGEIPFNVRTGPGIAVVGLSDGETIRGRIPVLVNAFASRPGDVFEPTRAETPAPIPTWAWVLFLVVAAWGMWFVATEFRAYQESLA